MRYLTFFVAVGAMLLFAILTLFVGAWALGPMAFAGSLTALGIWDMVQTHHALRRNYPIMANLRFLLESIRPEIRQYFLESDLDGAPFNRIKRSVVYARAKGQLQSRPFGTMQDVYGEGFEWLAHSMAPTNIEGHDFRVKIGGPDCKHPYSSALLNISAMSFGSLSANAIRALNKGAKAGGFAHDTGEGSFSVHHKEGGGDTIWEIGSGYFGCRNGDGTFSPERFAKTAAEPQIKMIEIKLSQGAKPGHGGILPAAKVTPEIAAARGVPMGQDCVSPAKHSAFSTPLEMMAFIAQLRELSGGKPVGFKLCIGQPTEFMALCKAMIETGVTPDFIVIDGKEGGTGAAPLEFADHVGTPLREGLTFAHNCLVGAGLRDTIRLGASGRIITGFDIVRVMALGADWCNSARGFMFALGCIQSMSCHTDKCPTGVATQDPRRGAALLVPDKAERVRRFQASTMEALAELTAAAGLMHPMDISRDQLMRRTANGDVLSFGEVYPQLRPGSLIDGTADAKYARHWSLADAGSFRARVA